MTSCSPSPLALLVTLALLPLHVFGAERAEHAGSVAIYEQLHAAEPYVEKPDEDTVEAVAKYCLTLDRQCMSFSRGQPEMMLAVVPDNPEYWAAYDSSVATEPTRIEQIVVDDLPTFSGIIEGTRNWLRRELLTKQMSDAQQLQEQISVHRRRLASSGLLIEKMIFLATTGMLLPAINVHMAHHSAAGLPDNKRLLDCMLAPLGSDELSLRAALDGELRLAESHLESGSYEAGMMNDVRRVYRYVSDRSEASWEDYWLNGLDIHGNVPGLLAEDEWFHALSDYSTHTRYLDAVLHVLRALREVYEGRASPGPPPQSPPAGWLWDWHSETQSLCLEPGSIHPTLVQPETICVEYLDRNLFR